MCLSTQCKIKMKTTGWWFTKRVIGWKIIRNDNSPLYEFDAFTRFKEGENVADTSETLFSDTNPYVFPNTDETEFYKPYEAGFHVFTTLEHAKHMAAAFLSYSRVKIIKVFIKPKDITTTGIQHWRGDLLDVMVCSKLTVKSLKNLIVRVV